MNQLSILGDWLSFYKDEGLEGVRFFIQIPIFVDRNRRRREDRPIGVCVREGLTFPACLISNVIDFVLKQKAVEREESEALIDPCAVSGNHLGTKDRMATFETRAASSKEKEYRF